MTIDDRSEPNMNKTKITIFYKLIEKIVNRFEGDGPMSEWNTRQMTGLLAFHQLKCYYFWNS